MKYEVFDTTSANAAGSSGISAQIHSSAFRKLMINRGTVWITTVANDKWVKAFDRTTHSLMNEWQST